MLIFPRMMQSSSLLIQLSNDISSFVPLSVFSYPLVLFIDNFSSKLGRHYHAYPSWILFAFLWSSGFLEELVETGSQLLLKGEVITLLIILKRSFFYLSLSSLHPLSLFFPFIFLPYFNFTRHLKFLVTLTFINVISVANISGYSDLKGTQKLTKEYVGVFFPHCKSFWAN